MPIYKYECSFCGHTFKELQSLSEEPLKDCPECVEKFKNGQLGTLKKVIGMPLVIFKGSGFYCTDNPSSSQQSNNAQREADQMAQAKEDKIKHH
jgi:putative FmdB family regulatory protein